MSVEIWLKCPNRTVVNPDSSLSTPSSFVNPNYCCRFPIKVVEGKRSDGIALLSPGGHLDDQIVVSNLTNTCGKCDVK